MSINQIYVNLPVADVARSTAFYEALGFTKNPQFSDENSSCVVIGDNIFVMIMTREKLQGFTKHEVATDGVRVINALGADSREGVDHVVDAALAAGATASNDTQDYGWMYNRAFADPDGHHWEVAYMDEEAMKEAFAEDAGQA
ncbi:VOC family protein [Myceligenerans salitolerans]|uniref:VOC family protein n=1 Tax=Myceligenerans salitolerans TaxID=1230528 RepID=A0ABS3I563_9MICO|nr:VOC family protein [Myceligenerans salitolerans]MBO0608108.1 VOC family protein [Myceligenerans salitolerans]